MKRTKERAWREKRAWRETWLAARQAMDRKPKKFSANRQERVNRENRILEREHAEQIVRLIREGQYERAGLGLFTFRGPHSTPDFMRLVAALLDGKAVRKTSGGKRAERTKAVLKAFNAAARGKKRAPTWDEFEAEYEAAFYKPFKWQIKLAELAEKGAIKEPKIPKIQTERSLRRTLKRLGLYLSEVKPGPKS